MKNIITIVVPVYNVEKYLVKCIDSILAQTYKSLEIILVDDGSTDNSGEICDKYKSLDNRITVIHKENGGLSSARNAGIDIAKGDYIGFVDSDDYIHPMMYEILLRNILKTDSEIAICGYKEVFDDDSIHQTYEYSIKNEAKSFNKIEILDKIFTSDHALAVVAWNKLYKIELFDNIRYPLGKIHEDEFTTYKLIHKSQQIILNNDELYYYLQRTTSIMGQQFNIKRLQALEAYKERTAFLKEKGHDYLYIRSAYAYLRAISRHYLIIKKARLGDELLKSLREQFIKEYKDFNINKHLNIKKRLSIYAFYISPKLYEILVDISEKKLSLKTFRDQT